MKSIILILVTVGVTLSACSRNEPVATPAPLTDDAIAADTVYTNGRIYTVDEDQPWAEAVAIEDGKFVSVGTNEAGLALAGSETEVIDLKGQFVAPGLVSADTVRQRSFGRRLLAFRSAQRH